MGGRAAMAGACLSLAVLAACGSSGSGTVAGQPPNPSPASSSPSDFPGPSTSVTPTTPDDRTFAGSGIRLTVPDGYVIATTAAQAADRFPDVLGNDADARSKVLDAEARLRKNTLMIAFHAPDSNFTDNISLSPDPGTFRSPADVQSPSFLTAARKSLSAAGAKSVEFADLAIGGQPAKKATYSIAVGSTRPFYGEQIYAIAGTRLLYLTVTAATQSRAEAAANEIADSWAFD